MYLFIFIVVDISNIVIKSGFKGSREIMDKHFEIVVLSMQHTTRYMHYYFDFIISVFYELKVVLSKSTP